MPKAITTNRKNHEYPSDTLFGVADMHVRRLNQTMPIFESDYAYSNPATHSLTRHPHTYCRTGRYFRCKTVASLHKPHGFIFIVALSEIYVINYKDR